MNERDEIGDDLVPDYVTRVQEGGFYGWPWFYMGGHQDPRHPGKHPELKEKVITPDVLIQSHSASLDLAFYDGSQFPAEYREHAFAAEHGSWNRTRRTGYKVIRIPTENGKATGEYIDFLTGFVTPEGDVWGRPVGVTVAKDGALARDRRRRRLHLARELRRAEEMTNEREENSHDRGAVRAGFFGDRVVGCILSTPLAFTGLLPADQACRLWLRQGHHYPRPADPHRGARTH